MVNYTPTHFFWLISESVLFLIIVKNNNDVILNYLHVLVASYRFNNSSGEGGAFYKTFSVHAIHYCLDFFFVFAIESCESWVSSFWRVQSADTSWKSSCVLIKILGDNSFHHKCGVFLAIFIQYIFGSVWQFFVLVTVFEDFYIEFPCKFVFAVLKLLFRTQKMLNENWKYLWCNVISLAKSTSRCKKGQIEQDEDEK